MLPTRPHNSAVKGGVPLMRLLPSSLSFARNFDLRMRFIINSGLELLEGIPQLILQFIFIFAVQDIY